MPVFPLFLLLGVGTFVLYRWSAPHAPTSPGIPNAANTATSESKAGAPKHKHPHRHTPHPQQTQAQVHALQMARAAAAKRAEFVAAAARNAAEGYHSPPPPGQAFSPIAPMQAAPIPTVAQVNRAAQVNQATQALGIASPFMNSLASQAGIPSNLTSQALNLGTAATSGASLGSLGTGLATDVTSDAIAAATSYQTGDASSVPNPLEDGSN